MFLPSLRGPGWVHSFDSKSLQSSKHVSDWSFTTTTLNLTSTKVQFSGTKRHDVISKSPTPVLFPLSTRKIQKIHTSCRALSYPYPCIFCLFPQVSSATTEPLPCPSFSVDRTQDQKRDDVRSISSNLVKGSERLEIKWIVVSP